MVNSEEDGLNQSKLSIAEDALDHFQLTNEDVLDQYELSKEKDCLDQGPKAHEIDEESETTQPETGCALKQNGGTNPKGM